MGIQGSWGQEAWTRQGASGASAVLEIPCIHPLGLAEGLPRVSGCQLATAAAAASATRTWGCGRLWVSLPVGGSGCRAAAEVWGTCRALGGTTTWGALGGSSTMG